ncbi:hypothetical protein DICPUDRAFT_160272 [Dictyostelium purpureum]|uniref:Uncharacterized protein n=1 Tax=Dictyostelium purpureum TaxID=5786 RepID=F1A620_DICPU|nr:uncharacterized protein DICPUDRAFT_160272 [Dictyostelium purpureum]EGC28362.1 hypothetical protein DICPUDRAFT_160272 [Dictyostelium purpureum]|eukprot:XP_003295114.1 hypothetical protein DICPUDRAFT_160272 [Dictyostelium purpureum]
MRFFQSLLFLTFFIHFSNGAIGDSNNNTSITSNLNNNQTSNYNFSVSINDINNNTLNNFTIKNKNSDVENNNNINNINSSIPIIIDNSNITTTTTSNTTTKNKIKPQTSFGTGSTFGVNSGVSITTTGLPNTASLKSSSTTGGSSPTAVSSTKPSPTSTTTAASTSSNIHSNSPNPTSSIEYIPVHEESISTTTNDRPYIQTISDKPKNVASDITLSSNGYTLPFSEINKATTGIDIKLKDQQNEIIQGHELKPNINDAKHSDLKITNTPTIAGGLADLIHKGKNKHKDNSDNNNNNNNSNNKNNNNNNNYDDQENSSSSKILISGIIYLVIISIIF